MYTESDILAKCWKIREVVNLVLFDEKLEVAKMFLIGSYASGRQNEWSDLDILVQLKGGKRIGQTYPSWKQIKEIHTKMKSQRLHIIFGTEEAAKSLHEKNKNYVRNYAYREIHLGGITNARTYSSSN